MQIFFSFIFHHVHRCRRTAGVSSHQCCQKDEPKHLINFSHRSVFSVFLNSDFWSKPNSFILKLIKIIIRKVSKIHQEKNKFIWIRWIWLRVNYCELLPSIADATSMNESILDHNPFSTKVSQTFHYLWKSKSSLQFICRLFSDILDWRLKK